MSDGEELVERDRDLREHVTARQPLVHLFTVPLKVVRERVRNGSKYVDKPHPKGRRR